MDYPDSIRTNVTHRMYRGINIQENMENLQSSQHLSKCEGSIMGVVETNNKSVQCVITRHASSCLNMVVLKPESPCDPR